jgi:hypothetical protein
METPHSASIISATGGQHEDPVVIDRVEGMKYRVGWLTRADLLEEGRIGLRGHAERRQPRRREQGPAEEVDGDPRGDPAFRPATGSSP